MLLSLLATVYGAIVCSTRFAEPFTEIGIHEFGDVTLVVTVDTFVVGFAAAVATFLSWYWARGRWRLLAACFAGLAMTLSALWSTARHPRDPSVLLQLAFVARPLAFGAIVAVIGLTTLAHTAFRFRFDVANYRKR